MSDSKGPIIVCGCLSFIAFILIVVLVPMHFSYVNLNNLGLKKGTTSGRVDTDEAYETGRYGWGVTKTAVNFDNTWKRVAFINSLAPRVFTDAGEIIVGVQFYYAITKAGLPMTFGDFADRYDRVIRQQALDAIKNAAANFTTTQYQTQRANITDTMYNAVRSSLESLVHVTVPRSGFFLVSIDLPNRVLTKRLESFEQEQEQITQQFELRNQQYRLATAQNVSRIERLTDVVASQAAVDARGLRDSATNKARADQQSEAGRQLQAMLSALGLSGNTNGTQKLVRFNAMLDFSKPVTILNNVIGNVFV